MIKLLRLPKGNISLLLGQMITDYMLSVGAPISSGNSYLSAVDDVYIMYKDNNKIGFFTFIYSDGHVVGDALYIVPKYRRYLMHVIKEVDLLVKNLGYTGLIVHPDKYTENLYNKYNLAKEI